MNAILDAISNHLFAFIVLAFAVVWIIEAIRGNS